MDKVLNDFAPIGTEFKFLGRTFFVIDHEVFDGYMEIYPGLNCLYTNKRGDLKEHFFNMHEVYVIFKNKQRVQEG
ncbi:MAG: hypothetical protein R3230_00145 [Nitrosopumilaceae archaeon]|nr:hypothetical protein [Nitrosopumilaceae archaeon]